MSTTFRTFQAAEQLHAGRDLRLAGWRVTGAREAPVPGLACSLSRLLNKVRARVAQWLAGSSPEQSIRERRIRLEERGLERMRVARELDGTIIRKFEDAFVELHEMSLLLPETSPSQPALRRTLALMEEALDEGRDRLKELRSSAATLMNLEQAIAAVRDEFTSPDCAPIRVFVQGNKIVPLNSEVKQQLYLISREALINALRHSGAESIEAEVEYTQARLRVVVRDNGCGISPEVLNPENRDCSGLPGMRDRAGSIGARLRISSRPGGGTEVEISIPTEIACDTAV